MTIQPLPVPTRIFNGEGLISYASRHAARNGTTVEEIERALFEGGAIPKPSHRRTPERLQAWRDLGDLHESAFTTPAKIDGSEVIDRELCLRCTQGSGGTARLPRIGWVCARHCRWLGTTQHDIRALPELIAAERHYRRDLAPRGVLVDSPIMLWARECATTVLRSSTVVFRQSTVRERSRRGSTSDLDLLAYPETVNVARLATSPGFNTRMLQPGLWHRDRYDLSIKAVAGFFPAAHEDESLRAAHRITAFFDAIAWNIKRNPPPSPADAGPGTPLGQAWSTRGR
ncbi:MULTISPECIES: hypothetical protein [Arthrobacter]|uniref:TniQ protein n=1 Tax=Arthrobacter oryzae TaxID=409290 RepID=A0A3N0BRN6_9MICC|nr:hypothetical protein [Arthrobacter oryzae]RNL51720.1 hypothetical protein D7003_15225 [Arthrobacter oryzae]